MAKYAVNWDGECTHWSEVEVKSKKQAIEKMLAGLGIETSVTTSDRPDAEYMIDSIERIK